MADMSSTTTKSNSSEMQTTDEPELHLDALHLERPRHDMNDLHASLDLVSHTQRTGARGEGLVSRGRIMGFEDSFDDSMMLGESFAVDDRDEPRRANPNAYRQLECIQDMTEEDDEEEDSNDEDEDDDDDGDEGDDGIDDDGKRPAAADDDDDDDDQQLNESDTGTANHVESVGI